MKTIVLCRFSIPFQCFKVRPMSNAIPVVRADEKQVSPLTYLAYVVSIHLASLEERICQKNNEKGSSNSIKDRISKQPSYRRRRSIYPWETYRQLTILPETSSTQKGAQICQSFF
jgi:hypothetical protein